MALGLYSNTSVGYSASCDLNPPVARIEESSYDIQSKTVVGSQYDPYYGSIPVYSVTYWCTFSCSGTDDHSSTVTISGTFNGSYYNSGTINLSNGAWNYVGPFGRVTWTNGRVPEGNLYAYPATYPTVSGSLTVTDGAGNSSIVSSVSKWWY